MVWICLAKQLNSISILRQFSSRKHARDIPSSKGGERQIVRQVAFYVFLTQSLSSIIKRNWKLKWKISGGESNPDRLGESPERIPLDHYGLMKEAGLNYLFIAALWCMYYVCQLSAAADEKKAVRPLLPSSAVEWRSPGVTGKSVRAGHILSPSLRPAAVGRATELCPALWETF